MPKNCGRQAFVEAEWAISANDFGSNPKRGGGASGREWLAVELESSLGEVYRKGGGLGDHGRERGQCYLRVGFIIPWLHGGRAWVQRPNPRRCRASLKRMGSRISISDGVVLTEKHQRRRFSSPISSRASSPLPLVWIGNRSLQSSLEVFFGYNCILNIFLLYKG